MGVDPIKSAPQQPPPAAGDKRHSFGAGYRAVQALKAKQKAIAAQQSAQQGAATAAQHKENPTPANEIKPGGRSEQTLPSPTAGRQQPGWRGQ